MRGAALTELGQTELGIRSLRASLAAALQRDAGHEVATPLSALLAAGAHDDEEEAARWRRERATIVATLGIVEPKMSVSD